MKPDSDKNEGEKRGSVSKLATICILGHPFTLHCTHPYILYHFNCRGPERVSNNYSIHLYYLTPYHMSSILLRTLHINSFNPLTLIKKYMHVIIIPILQ